MIKRVDVSILLIFFIISTNSATSTVTQVQLQIDNHTIICFGQQVRLLCIHRPIDPTEYFPRVSWLRNGEPDFPDGIIERESTINETTVALDVNVTRREFENVNISYQCFLRRRNFTEKRSNETQLNPLDKPQLPNINQYQLRIRTTSLAWEYSTRCFEDYIFSFPILWCTVENGVPNVSTINSTTTSTDNITLYNLVHSTTYHVNITAQSVENSTIRSDTVEMEVFTLDAISVSKSPKIISCYDRQVQLTCHHHDINDTTSSGPIFNQTSPVVWMKDGERIDLPDTYHMNVSQNNTETVVNVTTKKSVFLNGEANYSCAAMYADGSMEESEYVTVVVVDGIPSESPLPPTSLTSIPSDISIFLIWSHSDECFDNCTFMYEVTWQQSVNGSSLRNTTTAETSYTIEGLTPGTSYEIGVGAYCREEQSLRSEELSTRYETAASNSAAGTGVSDLMKWTILIINIIMGV